MHQRKTATAEDRYIPHQRTTATADDRYVWIAENEKSNENHDDHADGDNEIGTCNAIIYYENAVADAIEYC